MRLRREGLNGFGCCGNRIERVGYRGVISGGGGEGLFCETPAGFACQSAVGAFHFLDDCGVLRHAGDNGDIFEVLGGGTDHGGAADVDVFDEVAEGNAGQGGGLLEGIEVDDDHVDGLDSVRGDGGFVLGVATNVEQASVDARVQRFYASVEHLGKAGEIADVLYGQPSLAQRACRAAGGDQLDAEAGENFGQINEAGFVGHAEQCPADRFLSRLSMHTQFNSLAIFVGWIVRRAGAQERRPKNRLHREPWRNLYVDLN